MKKIKLKSIEEYEGLYSVTPDGRVWSHERKEKVNWKFGEYTKMRYAKWLKLHLDTVGYLITGLCKNGKETKHRIHRLVAQAYIPNPSNKPCINHLSGVKTDNRVENLEWVTHKENTQHAYKIGLYDNRDVSGEKNGKAKLIWKQINEIRENQFNRKIGDKRWREYGISRRHYYLIINNKTWYDPEYKKEIIKNAIV